MQGECDYGCTTSPAQHWGARQRSMEETVTVAAASPVRVAHKRRLLRDQVSISEPPLKSPARLFDDGDIQFKFDADYVSRIGVVFADKQFLYSSAPHPSPALGVTVMAKEGLGQLENMAAGPARDRRSSKDVLDEYFATRNSRSRRRSSIMEASQGIDDFLEAENLKSDCEKKVSKESDVSAASTSSTRKPLSSCKRRDSRFSRSLSAEGYDPEDLRDRKQETQALLFDSTPDLSVEENYRRFPSIRCARRGAVCYDLQAPLEALRDLCVDDK